MKTLNCDGTASFAEKKGECNAKAAICKNNKIVSNSNFT